MDDKTGEPLLLGFLKAVTPTSPHLPVFVCVFFLLSYQSLFTFSPPKLNAGWKAGLRVGIILSAPPPRPGLLSTRDRWPQHLQVSTRGTWSHMPASPLPSGPFPYSPPHQSPMLI